MLIKENDKIQKYYLSRLDHAVTLFEDSGEVTADEMIIFCRMYMRLSPRRQQRYKVMLNIVNELWKTEANLK